MYTYSGVQTPAEPSTGAPELAAAVDELLDQLQHKFDGVSTEIFGKRESSPFLYLVYLLPWPCSRRSISKEKGQVEL